MTSNGHPRIVPEVVDNDGCLVAFSLIIVHFVAAVAVIAGVIVGSPTLIVWPLVVVAAWWLGALAGAMT
jgi:hypothetical protein